jgi:hypothetical protein
MPEFAADAVRLELYALAHNPSNFRARWRDRN